METAGFQLRYIDVRDRAGELLRLNHGHNSPYRDCSPGHNWLAGFLKRHPGKDNHVKTGLQSTPESSLFVPFISVQSPTDKFGTHVSQGIASLYSLPWAVPSNTMSVTQ